jgi:hypothetical protein
VRRGTEVPPERVRRREGVVGIHTWVQRACVRARGFLQPCGVSARAPLAFGSPCVGGCYIEASGLNPDQTVRELIGRVTTGGLCGFHGLERAAATPAEQAEAAERRLSEPTAATSGTSRRSKIAGRQRCHCLVVEPTMSSPSIIWGNFRVGNKKQVEGANKGGQQQQDWLDV